MSNKIIEVTAKRLNNEGNYAIVEQNTSDAMIVSMWVAKSNSANTKDQYQRQADSFLSFVGKPLQALTLADLQAWQASLTGSINTKRLKVNAIKSLFSFAHKVGYLNVNPGVMLEPEHAEETKHRKTLTEEQIIRLVTVDSISPRDEAIIRVMYSTGCRVSELTAMRWQDVITTSDGKAEIVIRGKGGKTRNSGISKAAYDALLVLCNAECLPDDYIFQSNRKQQMDRTTVNHLFNKLSAVIGKHVSPHYLRHSHASNALAKGASPVDVQEQLGHSSLQVTTGYAHKTRSSSDFLVI